MKIILLVLVGLIILSFIIVLCVSSIRIVGEPNVTYILCERKNMDCDYVGKKIYKENRKLFLQHPLLQEIVPIDLSSKTIHSFSYECMDLNKKEVKVDISINYELVDAKIVYQILYQASNETIKDIIGELLELFVKDNIKDINICENCDISIVAEDILSQMNNKIKEIYGICCNLVEIKIY